MKLAEGIAPGLQYQLDECRAGEHEDCPGNRLEPVGGGPIVAGADLWRRHCACGCHRLDPWPWPHA